MNTEEIQDFLKSCRNEKIQQALRLSNESPTGQLTNRQQLNPEHTRN